MFEFPEGIGPVECVNVEHEEVVLMPRVLDAKRVTFKFGLGDEFIEVLRTLNKLGLDRTEPVTVRGHKVSPRDVVAACLPDPLTLGDKMTGKTCAGVWVTGKGKDGAPREVYIYHVSDNEWTMAEYGAQAVVWQTAMNPVVALELLASGAWSGAGVIGPESFEPEALPRPAARRLRRELGRPGAHPDGLTWLRARGSNGPVVERRFAPTVESAHSGVVIADASVLRTQRAAAGRPAGSHRGDRVHGRVPRVLGRCGGRREAGGGRCGGRGTPGGRSASDPALEALRVRYARGEVDRDTFLATCART